jgi:hypothetical protein
MLRLAARYADIRNAPEYLGAKPGFEPLLRAFETARSEVGDAASHAVQTSVILKIGWPDLGALPGFFGDDYLTGSAEEIALAWRDYAAAGVGHLLCQYHPNTRATLERLIAALEAYRRFERAAP